MPKVVGVDPGTGSMDILGFDDESMEVFLEESIPRDLVTRDPGIVVRKIEEAARSVGGVDAVVAPSGYGVPLKPARDASDSEICEATFIHGADYVARLRIVGLRELMRLFKNSDLPAWFTPGVIQLPTVPDWRKTNRIDLGTADKVYTAAAALRAEVEIHGVGVDETRFVVVEAGLAYTAAMAVELGAIVDGVGGTSGGPGFLGAGCMDAEVAYALAHVSPGFSKTVLFRGGASSVAREPTIEGLEKRYLSGDERGITAVKMLAETTAKNVASLLPSLKGPPRRIYLSGRLARAPVIGEEIRLAVEGLLDALGLSAEVKGVPSLGNRTKEGATGAAIIASGLAGGRYEWVVDSLGLRGSRGSIFDYIVLDDKLPSYLKAEFSYCP